MQPAAPFTPVPAFGLAYPSPDPSSLPAPLQPGMFRGYEVQVGHPAGMAEPEALAARQVRAKRPAQDMSPSLPEGKAQGSACERSGSQAQAKRPYAPPRPSTASWVDPDFATFEHPLALAGEEDPATDPDPVPQPYSAGQADSLLKSLDAGDDRQLLRRIQGILAQDRLSRRQLAPDSTRHHSLALIDHGTFGQALARRWGGTGVSDQRLDLLAHWVSHEAGLAIKEDVRDLELTMFLRGLFSEFPDKAVQCLWVRRILEQAFSKAHSAHLADPYAGRGVLRLLLRTFHHSKVEAQMLTFILDHSLVSRSRLSAGDPRLRWDGADLQVTVNMARRALVSPECRVHPELLRWLGQAGQFSPDELSFLAAGIGIRVPLVVEDLSEEGASKAGPARGYWPSDFPSRFGRGFLDEATLGGPHLAAACLGLARGIGYPHRLLEGRGLVDSLSLQELRELGMVVGQLVQGASHPQAAAARMGQALVRWVMHDPAVEAPPAQYREWQDARREVLATFLGTAARQMEFEALKKLLAELRQQLYGGLPLSRDRAQRFLATILPPVPADPTSEADWAQVRQCNELADVLTAPPAPSRSQGGQSGAAAAKDGRG